MSKTVGFGPGYDADCTAQVITTHARQDFLAVSEASFTTAAKVRMVANRFCGTAIAPGQVIASEFLRVCLWIYAVYNGVKTVC